LEESLPSISRECDVTLLTVFLKVAFYELFKPAISPRLFGIQAYRTATMAITLYNISYPSFQLGLVDGTVVEEKADGVDLTNVFVDDFRISRVVVTQQAA